MTVGQMRGTIQSLVGPHNGMAPLSAPILDDLIHKACHAVFHAIRNWRTTSEALSNLVANQSEYSLPADILRIESVVVPNANGDGEAQVRPVDADQRHLYSEPNATQAYYLKASGTPGVPVLVLLPTPTADATNGLAVRYRRRPVKMSTFGVDDEFTECDTALHLPLCYEAAFLYLNRPGSRVTKDILGYHAYFQSEVGLEKERQQEMWSIDFQPKITASFGGLD